MPDPLILGLRSGDSAAIADFCKQYGGIVEQLAEKHLGAALRRRVGADDVAQSVCRTFVMRAQRGEFVLEDGGDLWRLLCAITVTKVREQARFHGREKRGMQGEQHFDSLTPDGSPRVPESAGRERGPQEAAEFAETFERLMGGLDPDERRMVELKLAGHTHDEVAEQLACSERTVRRLMKRLQAQLERQLE